MLLLLLSLSLCFPLPKLAGAPFDTSITPITILLTLHPTLPSLRLSFHENMQQKKLGLIQTALGAQKET